MYIEMKKCVDVPKNLYCNGCSAFSDGFSNEYCCVTGELLKAAGDGTYRFLKTNTCFAEVRKYLINGGN